MNAESISDSPTACRRARVRHRNGGALVGATAGVQICCVSAADSFASHAMKKELTTRQTTGRRFGKSSSANTATVLCFQYGNRIYLPDLKDRETYVAYATKLDVSSCGASAERAQKSLLEAVRLSLEEAEKMGTLDQILEEAGYVRRKQKLKGPKFITAQPVSLSLPLVRAGY